MKLLLLFAGLVVAKAQLDPISCSLAVVGASAGGTCGGLSIQPVTQLTTVSAWQANNFAQCNPGSLFFQFLDCATNSILSCLNCRNYSTEEFASRIAPQADLGCIAVQDLNACTGAPTEAQALQKCADLDVILNDILAGNGPCSWASQTTINSFLVMVTVTLTSYLMYG